MDRTYIYFTIISTALLHLTTVSLLHSAPSDPNWQLVWADECNGSAGSAVDGSKWNMVNKGDGFGNNELQYYTNRTANSYYDGEGNLVIKTMKENYESKNYTSAKLYSRNKGDWTYCRVSIRAILPEGVCIWPAFWMMPTSSQYGGWPSCGEIDIMELRGDRPNRTGGTIHFGNPWKYIGASYTLPSPETFDADYHLFDLEWEEGEFRWYVDENLYGTRTYTEWYTSGADKATKPYAPFDQNFYVQLNTAVGGPNTPYTGNQSPDDNVFPQFMYVDYVRVYQRGDEVPVRQTLSVKTERPLFSIHRSGDAITLVMPSPREYRIEFFTLNGRLKKALSFSGDSYTFTLKTVPPGIYVVRSAGASETMERRVVITR